MQGGVYDDLLSEVCRQIEACGLKLKEAEAAIIDATLIEDAAARAYIEAPQDRAEGDEPDDPELHFSADPDARWVKKGSRALWVTRALPAPTKGFVTKVHTISASKGPANKGESPEVCDMIDGAKAQRVLADKAYASKANRDMLRSRHRDGIMRKAVRGALCGLRKSASTS